GYNPSSSTYRSLLQTVTVYGAANFPALPPQTFTFGYQAKPFAFEPIRDWSPVTSEAGANPNWNSPSGTDSGILQFEPEGTAQLADINGDGLPDRVLRKYLSAYDCFKVQLNTGNGFSSSLTDWANVKDELGGTTSSHWNGLTTSTYNNAPYSEEIVQFLDINGDHLPDRVMHKRNSPFDSFKVQ